MKVVMSASTLSTIASDLPPSHPDFLFSLFEPVPFR
jgi:hypothetical protein